MDRDTLLELIPAYSLGALDEPERSAVEALLAADPEAQRLIAEYQLIADTLVFSAPSRQAPAHLRSQLQSRLQQEQGQKPVLAGPRSIRWMQITAAAAVFVMVVSAGFFALRQSPVPEPTRGRARALFNEITVQNGAQRMSIEAAIAGVEGELAVAPDGTQAVLRLAQLPALPENQAFQLWLIEADTRTSGGVFQWPSGHGPYYIIMPLDKPLARYTGFGMSIEPADGSPLITEPSGPRVWGLNLNTTE